MSYYSLCKRIRFEDFRKKLEEKLGIPPMIFLSYIHQKYHFGYIHVFEHSGQQYMAYETSLLTHGFKLVTFMQVPIEGNLEEAAYQLSRLSDYSEDVLKDFGDLYFPKEIWSLDLCPADVAALVNYSCSHRMFFLMNFQQFKLIEETSLYFETDETPVLMCKASPWTPNYYIPDLEENPIPEIRFEVLVEPKTTLDVDFYEEMQIHRSKDPSTDPVSGLKILHVFNVLKDFYIEPDFKRENYNFLLLLQLLKKHSENEVALTFRSFIRSTLGPLYFMANSLWNKGTFINPQIIIKDFRMVGTYTKFHVPEEFRTPLFKPRLYFKSLFGDSGPFYECLTAIETTIV
jgi:hypothetical protein